jgi:CubicO group peptidase (beta-lactamase class C family)
MALLPDLSDRIAAALATHQVPGAAIAVGYGDELASAAAGVVSRNTGVPATPDTVFQIGSVTKVWTAVLVMQLVDEGLIDLDQPVRRYLDTFAVADPELTGTVTPRQLLSHTSGFDGDLFVDTGRGDDALDKFLRYLHDHATALHPAGELYSYCNAGYCVLGALVAHLRGVTWEAALRERVIDPLGARHMALSAEEAILFRAAVGHLKAGDADTFTATPRWQLPRSNAPAGATPCAAPADLVRFGRMFLAGGTAQDGTRLLSGEAIAAMRSPQVTVPGTPTRGARQWGLGFMLFDWNGTSVIGHDGGTIGQAALWRILPDHDLVIAMNVNGGNAGPFFDELLDSVVAELTGVRVPARPVPPQAPTPEPGPAEYAGRYAFPLQAYEVVVADNGFDITLTPKGIAAELGYPPKTVRYVKLSGDTYIATEPDEGAYPTLTFVDGGRYVHNSRAARRLLD